MSLFSDFIGGAATSLSKNIETKMLEDIRAKADEKKMRLQNKFSRGEIKLSNALAGKREAANAASMEARTKIEQDAMNIRNAADLEYKNNKAIEDRAAANARNAATTGASRYATDTRRDSSNAMNARMIELQKQRAEAAQALLRQRQKDGDDSTPAWMKAIGMGGKKPLFDM